MRISEEEPEITISTTETRLAQAIGRALSHAFKGDLHFDFEEDIVRVSWQRDH